MLFRPIHPVNAFDCVCPLGFTGKYKTSLNFLEAFIFLPLKIFVNEMSGGSQTFLQSCAWLLCLDDV